MNFKKKNIYIYIFVDVSYLHKPFTYISYTCAYIFTCIYIIHMFMYIDTCKFYMYIYFMYLNNHISICTYFNYIIYIIYMFLQNIWPLYGHSRMGPLIS